MILWERVVGSDPIICYYDFSQTENKAPRPSPCLKNDAKEENEEKLWCPTHHSQQESNHDEGVVVARKCHAHTKGELAQACQHQDWPPPNPGRRIKKDKTTFRSLSILSKGHLISTAVS